MEEAGQSSLPKLRVAQQSALLASVQTDLQNILDLLSSAKENPKGDPPTVKLDEWEIEMLVGTTTDALGKLQIAVQAEKSKGEVDLVDEEGNARGTVNLSDSWETDEEIVDETGKVVGVMGAGKTKN